MELIRARNQQTAMPALLQTMYANGELDGEDLVIDHPVLFTFEAPRERLIFWPGIRRNPAQELSTALKSLEQAEEHLPAAAQTVVQGNDGFLFSTPRLLVQAKLRGSQIDLHAVVADTNPFVGAFGQMGLQMSILIELLAGSAKKNVGEMTIQHQALRLPKVVVEQLMGAPMPNIVEDPYRSMKPRKIDGVLGIKDLLENPGEAMGKSKWIRHVAGPLLIAGQAENVAAAQDLAKKVKADDFRRSMTEWCEAIAQAEAFKAAQSEGEVGGEG